MKVITQIYLKNLHLEVILPLNFFQETNQKLQFQVLIRFLWECSENNQETWSTLKFHPESSYIKILNHYLKMIQLMQIWGKNEWQQTKFASIIYRDHWDLKEGLKFTPWRSIKCPQVLILRTKIGQHETLNLLQHFWRLVSSKFMSLSNHLHFQVFESEVD